LCQISSFYFVLRRKGFRYKPIFQLKHSDMIQAYSLIVFQLAGQVCGAGVEIVNNTLGSMLGAGNVSALRLATRIIESFAGLLAGSIILAAMPTVAASVASGDSEGTKKHLQHALYLLLLVTVPLSIWLGVMHRPLIAFLYERARFSAADTTLVADLLLLMIPYIFLSRWWSLLELPFFAEQNTRTPLLGILITTTLYVVFTLLLVRRLGIYAVPIARSLAGLIGSCFLIYVLKRHMGNIGFGAVRDSTMRICAASFIMAVFMFLAIWLLPALPLQGFGAKVMALGLPSVIGSIALLMSLLSLGVLSPSLLYRLPPYLGRWPSRLLHLAGYPKDPL
jgi:putative peptidoglycan lipid II flippase